MHCGSSCGVVREELELASTVGQQGAARFI